MSQLLQRRMNAFETKIRGFHAKAVENIMKRRVPADKFRNLPRDQCNATSRHKSDNIITYIKKFEIDRENLHLAQRIMLCDSEHNHKKYEMEWKKNENFARVRSNFRRNLSNQEPRQFKISHISGPGSLLVSIRLLRVTSRPVCFKPGHQYSLTVHSKKQQPIRPTNHIFDVTSMSSFSMAFYLPRLLEMKRLRGRIEQLKENEVVFKGKFYFIPSETGASQVQILNKAGDKVIGTLTIQVSLEGYSKKSNNHERDSKSQENNPHPVISRRHQFVSLS